MMTSPFKGASSTNSKNNNTVISFEASQSLIIESVSVQFDVQSDLKLVVKKVSTSLSP